MSTDLDAFWMPFTANRQFKKAPRLLARSQGMHYWTTQGRQVLDAVAGLWCVNAGHNRPRIVQAIQQQAAETGLRAAVPDGPPQGLRAGQAVAALAPAGHEQGVLHQLGLRGGRDRAEDGHRLPPRPRRRHTHPADRPRARLPRRQLRRHLGRRHRRQPQDLRHAAAGVDHIRHTHDLARNAFSVGQPAHGAELADDLERLVALHDASTIAAVIVEPMAGSTGVLIPPKGYLNRLREICDKHGILLIFDEVITGFGRTGKPFGADTFGVTPDMMTVAKGITNGCVPMGAVIASSRSTTPS
jgi:beta-alanine--pyruvate transaminase